MLTVEQFNARCKSLHDGMKSSYRTRYWRTGKRAGMVRVPARELPFDLTDLRRHLAKRVGLNAKSCAYCGAAIDILTLSLDHQDPVSRGGSLAFGNLIECCADCNRFKGALTAEEYRQLLAFLSALPPAAQTDLRSRLKAGAMGIKQRFIQGRPDSAAPRPARIPRYRSPQLQLEENF